MPAVLNERFVLAEETALKAKFQGLTVTDPKDPSGATTVAVDVWFRYPDPEVRTVKYPFIVLDFVDMQKADHREHSGNGLEVPYVPYGMEWESGDPPIVADEWPTPYDLYYTVSVYTLDPRHDRELKIKLLADPVRLPHRLAYLELEDGTTRRLDVLDVSPQVRRDAEKTEHVTIFTVLVESELFPATVDKIAMPTTADLTLVETQSGITEEIATDLEVSFD